MGYPMSDDKVKFASGATSSAGHDAPYWLMTGHARKLGALRFGHGNVEHEHGNTVLAEANWLKAFHSRDLAFFRNRYTHAADHMDDEMHGVKDAAPGGNWGAAVWFIDVIAFVEAHDPEFYAAITGRQKHPGPKVQPCQCPRCLADLTLQTPIATFEVGISRFRVRESISQHAPLCYHCRLRYQGPCKHCYRCEDCCKCL